MLITDVWNNHVTLFTYYYEGTIYTIDTIYDNKFIRIAIDINKGHQLSEYAIDTYFDSVAGTRISWLYDDLVR